MKIKVVVHDVEEGGFWAEVPAIPGCATQGETMDELIRNLHEAIEGCLAVDVATPKPGGKECILENRRRFPDATSRALLSGMAGDCCASTAAIIPMARPAAWCAYLFRFTPIVRSRQACSVIWPSSRKFPTMN